LKVDLDFLMGEDDDLNPMDEETGKILPISTVKTKMGW
jgi:hypothetical protein